jgi:hypothetical protein
MTNLKGLLKKQFVKERSGAVATCKQIVEGKVQKYKFEIYHLTRNVFCTLQNNSNISSTHHQSTRSFSRAMFLVTQQKCHHTCGLLWK